MGGWKSKKEREKESKRGRKKGRKEGYITMGVSSQLAVLFKLSSLIQNNKNIMFLDHVCLISPSSKQSKLYSSCTEKANEAFDLS